MWELDERMVHESLKGMIVEELADVYLGHEAEPDEEKENIERAAVDRAASGLDQVCKAGAFQGRHRRNIKAIPLNWLSRLVLRKGRKRA